MSDTKLFHSVDDLKPFVFRITDNRGETLDRYTVTFCDGDYLGLSLNGAGFSQWGEGIDPEFQQERVSAGVEDDLSLDDLDPELVSHVMARLNEAFRDTMQDPKKVIAKSREQAMIHEGTHLSTGQGIYLENGAFHVRRDDDDEDLGPFPSMREAFLQTLPQAYCLTGPEHHSTVM